MTLGYLMLAITPAVSLNHHNRFVRASGTLLAAGCLLMIVLSIGLAHVDGSFAALRNKAGGADVQRPSILSTQALIALAAALGLVWAAWQPLRRGRLSPTPWRNSPQAFGLVSRYRPMTSAGKVYLKLTVIDDVLSCRSGSCDHEVPELRNCQAGA